MAFLDISLPLSADLPAWPDSPAVRLEPVEDRGRGAAANTSRLILGSHSGTHVDAPRHFVDGGAGTNGGMGVAALQRAAGSPPAARLLLKTSNSGLWSRPTFTPDFVFLEPDAAEWLVAAGVKLVGIGYLSIEQYPRPGAPAPARVILRR